MNILITGAQGQVGQELVKQGNLKGLHMVAVNHHELDISKRHFVEKTLFKNNVSLVINAAAYTAVDKAESEPDQAFAVNSKGPFNIASACSKANIPMIHISTDYVFNGEKKEPYVETDAISPPGVYGKSKAQGEAEVKKHLQQHIILRTSWVYGVHGNNFVKTMISLAKTTDTIRVVNDQFGCPTFARDIAKAIWSIVNDIQNQQKVRWGTYHYCGIGTTSWYGFAKKIFEIARQYEILAIKKVEPVSTDAYPTPAKRPLSSVLDCNLIHQHFDVIQKPWEQSIKEMLKDLYAIF